MRDQIKLVISIVLLIIVVIFAIQNTSTVELDLIFRKFNISLVLIILFSLLIGVIIGLIGSASTYQSLKATNRDLKKESAEIKQSRQYELVQKENEISKLREQLNEQKSIQRNTSTFDTSSQSDEVIDLTDEDKL